MKAQLATIALIIASLSCADEPQTLRRNLRMTDSRYAALVKGRAEPHEDGMQLLHRCTLDIQLVGNFRVIFQFSQPVSEAAVTVGGKTAKAKINDDKLTAEVYRGLLSVRPARSSRRGAKQIRIDTLRNKIQLFVGHNILEEVRIVRAVLDTEQSQKALNVFRRKW